MEFKIEDIFNKKESHLLGGYQTILELGQYTVYVTGGNQKFYGDFESTFGVTILNKDGEYITKDVIPSATDDIIGWVDKEHLMEMINSIPH